MRIIVGRGELFIRHAAILVLIGLGMTACTKPAPVQVELKTMQVQAAFQDGSGSFTGTTRELAEGGSVLTITSDKGLECSGRVFYVTYRISRGTLACSDGKSGAFELVTGGNRATGVGHINGKRITLNLI